MSDTDIDPMADEPSKKTEGYQESFTTELHEQVERQFTPPPPTLSPEAHALKDMEDAVVEEQAHHWGHILFAIFGSIAIITAFALVFVMSVAFTAGENSTSQFARTLAEPSLALLLAYATLISLILGLVGLGLGEWHRRTR
jgi:hypothetical protein